MIHLRFSKGLTCVLKSILLLLKLNANAKSAIKKAVPIMNLFLENNGFTEWVDLNE